MPDEMNKREVILTIREYENSVAMPEGERVTYLDPRGGVHLKDGDDKVPDYMGHAVKCAEYLRFGDEVDAVTCGEYPRSSAVKFCDTPELFVQAGFRPLPMLYTQRHLRDAIRPKSSYDPHRHGLTVEQMKRLPELMEHPVMLCDSPARDDTMLVVLRDVDCDDLPLIMAVRPMGAVITRLARLRPTSSWLSTVGRTSPATSTTSSRPIGSSIMTKKEAGNSMHLRSYTCFGATSSNPTSIKPLYADRSA